MQDQNVSTLECLEGNLGPQRDSLYVVIPIIVIYTVIFLTGVVGNVSTCIVISRNKSMHTATNYYLFSLAVSDLLLLVSGLPQEIYLIWSRYPYIFGAAFCFLRGLFAEISSNATVCTITAFTVERYLAICHPLRSHMMSKLSRAVRIIFVIWFFSVCLAVPQAMQFGIVVQGNCEICQLVEPMIEHSFELSSLVFFVAPMTLISVLYILIGLKLHQSKIMKRRNVSITGHRKSSRRIIKMLVAVVVAFFICWAPFHIQRLFAIYSSDLSNAETYDMYLKIYEVMTYSSGILYYLSATINPILYNIMSVKFREAFRETFSRCYHLSCFKSRQVQRSYSALSRSVPTGCDQASAEASGSGGKDSNAEVKYDPTSQTNTTMSQLESDRNIGGKRFVFPGDRTRMNSENSTVNNSSADEKVRCLYEMKTCNIIAVHVKPIEKVDKSKVSECCGLFPNKDNVRVKYSAQYSPTIFEATVFNRCENIKLDSPCHINNSSLKFMEREGTEDELTSYMKEIKRREKTVYAVHQ